MILAVIACSRG